VDVRHERVRAEDEGEAEQTSRIWVAKSTAARPTLIRADSWIPTMLSATRSTITTAPPTMSHGFCFSGSQKIER
jgi:hypothetical protein